eukprot:COSAG02_NODE_13905_length_1332_cov_1.576642_2_plen_142_part_00
MSYYKKFNKDYEKGISNEDRVIEFLNKDNVNKFCKCSKNYEFDFMNSEYTIELKSRRNNFNKYPSTMCGYNKLKIAEDNPDNKYKFLFLFTDGLYEWEYNKEEYTIKKGGRKDRGKFEYKDYAYIGIDKLKLLSDDIKSIF